MADRQKQELIRKDKKYIWHPFTQMADWVKDRPSEVLVIDSAKGVYLRDTEGKKYIDGVSSLWVTVHGHGKKELDQALKKQLSKMAHSTFLGLTHEPAITLAEKLIKIAPKGLSRVFYSDNGSTAVEIALKMAYQYWLQKGVKGRTSFFSLREAYHGDTIGSVSVGGVDLFHSKFKKLLFKTHYARSPHCFRCKFRSNDPAPLSFPGIIGESRNQHLTFCKHTMLMGCKGECIKDVERVLQKHHEHVAACIIEPMVQGAAGMLVMPPGYMSEFQRIARKYGLLLICDEVATGFGRTGRMFACEHEDIRPDFMCLAKGITGGYLPLAATLATENIYRGFLGGYDRCKTFFHGHTYTANPLAAACAVANLKIFEKEGLISKLQPKIRHFKKELNKLYENKSVCEIRQIGLMTGIELTGDDKMGQRACAMARTLGLIIRPLGNTVVLMPPLSISDQELTKMTRIVERSIISCTS
jgi:adenosylmethionine---8-amino-7-oxononanoate aminotransferase